MPASGAMQDAKGGMWAVPGEQVRVVANSSIAGHFRVLRNPSRVDAKRGEHSTSRLIRTYVVTARNQIAVRPPSTASFAP